MLFLFVLKRPIILYYRRTYPHRRDTGRATKKPAGPNDQNQKERPAPRRESWQAISTKETNIQPDRKVLIVSDWNLF